MQKPAPNPSDPKAKPKKHPRWRDLTDEEQWAQIYKGREQKRQSAPKTVHQAVALALPAYCLHMAVADCHTTFQATIRHDIHMAIVSGVAKVAGLLPTEEARSEMADKLHRAYGDIKRKGFYLHNREFLYAISHATVKLADDWRYPADSPACMAALMLKEDAETDEAGDWNLARLHSVKMAEVAYNELTATGLYGYGEAEAKRIQSG